MIASEPIINVGIVEKYQEVSGELLEKFKITDDVIVTGGFGIPIILPAMSYTGVAHAVPTEFVMPMISFTLLAVRV